jgi:hypothetical protein
MLVVTDQDLVRLSDGAILRLIITEYELNHPGESAHKVFPGILGCSTQCMSNWQSDKGAPSTSQWIALSRFTKSTIYKRYWTMKWQAQL